jgi:hypothetical protein
MPGCGAQVIAFRRRLHAQAAEAGWQVRLLLQRWASEDDAGEDRTDRCPDHPAVPYDQGEWTLRSAAADEHAHQRVVAALAAAGVSAEVQDGPDEYGYWRTTVLLAGRDRAEEIAAAIEAAGASAHGSPVPQPHS